MPVLLVPAGFAELVPRAWEDTATSDSEVGKVRDERKDGHAVSRA